MNLLRGKAYWPFFLIILVVIVFFRAFVFEGRLPIPSDTIIGLYHPFRDLYAQEYPNGIPFKNFLITDPVRQQYPWRELSIDLFKKFELPLWNPYSMAGYPLLGNHQSAPFYPLNILFLLMPFSLAWSLLILLQPLLAGIFLYLYLQNLRINPYASLLGSVSFAFSGFFIGWLEWGTILHVGLWLPLLLLSVDKIILSSEYKVLNTWSLLFIFSLTSSFFAGHLQTFFYVFLLTIVYMLVCRWQRGKRKNTLLLFAFCFLLFAIVAAVQWVPTLQLIGESARDLDRADWQQSGWFVPWQHLIQFVAPDFFGNPTTLNYWGVWNYGEFVGYIGILPLLMTIFALVARRDKNTLFFATVLILSLIFALPTFLAKLPYVLNVPFISTAQPTRLLFIADFSLTVLAAFGFDWLLKDRKKVWYPVILIGVILIGLWLFVIPGSDLLSAENREVANRNLRLPTILFVGSMLIFTAFQFLPRNRKVTLILCCILVAVAVFDLIRFGWKFTPFTDQAYLYSQTAVIDFLQKQEGQFRVMTTDDRVLPPNFSAIYRIQTIDGYDPLYLRRYGELIVASERGKPDISPPFGFNRIITPHNYDSKIIDLLGVRYVLSLTDLSSPKLTKVFQEGQTRVYENRIALPRAFFVEDIKWVGTNDEAIRVMFEENFDPRKMAVVENTKGGDPPAGGSPLRWNALGTSGRAEIIHYSENKIIIRTENERDGFLVLTDTFYPTWRATIDSSPATIYRVDYNFRSVIVPKGQHVIEFTVELF